MTNVGTAVHDVSRLHQRSSPFDSAVLVVDKSRSRQDADEAVGVAVDVTKVLGVAEAETKAVVKPDGVTDDLGREPIAAIAGGRLVISLLCQPGPQLDNASVRSRFLAALTTMQVDRALVGRRLREHTKTGGE